MTVAIVPSVFDSSLFIPDLRPKKRDSALSELAARAHASGTVRHLDLLCATLAMRESVVPSAIGKGVAIPNARSLAVIEPRLVVARSRRGIDWGAADGQLVHLVLLVLSPAEVVVEAHHDFVARAAGVARLQRNRTRLLEAPGYREAAQVLREVFE